MPLLRIVTSAGPEKESQKRLLADLSRFIAESLRKPEGYVMTSLAANATMTFAGTSEPACFVELKSIGTFTPEQTNALSAELCRKLEAALGVPPNRTYIEFTNAVGHLWGHDGETFG